MRLVAGQPVAGSPRSPACPGTASRSWPRAWPRSAPPPWTRPPPPPARSGRCHDGRSATVRSLPGPAPPPAAVTATQAGDVHHRRAVARPHLVERPLGDLEPAGALEGVHVGARTGSRSGSRCRAPWRSAPVRRPPRPRCPRSPRPGSGSTGGCSPADDEVRRRQLVELVRPIVGLQRVARHGHERDQEQADHQRVGRGGGPLRVAHGVVHRQAAGQPDAPGHRRASTMANSRASSGPPTTRPTNSSRAPGASRYHCAPPNRFDQQEHQRQHQGDRAEHGPHLRGAGRVHRAVPHGLDRLGAPGPERRHDHRQHRHDGADDHAQQRPCRR